MESIHAPLRHSFEAIAPLMFGARRTSTVSAVIEHGQRTAFALKHTLLIMLTPLASGELIMLSAAQTYPRDVGIIIVFAEVTK